MYAGATPWLAVGGLLLPSADFQIYLDGVIFVGSAHLLLSLCVRCGAAVPVGPTGLPPEVNAMSEWVTECVSE